jgi:hypothetical protein
MYSNAVASPGGDPTAAVFQPAECDTTLQNGDAWFYSPTVGIRSLATLVSGSSSWESPSPYDIRVLIGERKVAIVGERQVVIVGERQVSDCG